MASEGFAAPSQTSVSCGEVGYCVVTGDYEMQPTDDPFLLSEFNGHWGDPGAFYLNVYNGTLDPPPSVTCDAQNASQR